MSKIFIENCVRTHNFQFFNKVCLGTFFEERDWFYILLLTSVLSFSTLAFMRLEAESGDIVTVHFTVAFKSGEILESTRGKDPMRFKLGQGVFFPGFEKAILGMTIGQTKRLTISSQDAFGPKDPTLIREVKKSDIPPHIDASIGRHIHIKHDDANIVVTVVDDTDDSVILDANPPQAGEDFVISLELIDLA